jgi:predicted MFS family arabinose efflux permease
VPATALRRDLDADTAGSGARGALRDMREGFAYMIRTPWLLATLLFASLMILAMMGPLEVLVPYLIKSELGGDAGDHSFVLAAFGVGGAVGSLAMSSVRMPKRYLSWMMLMWAFGCLPFLAAAHATQVWVLVVAGFVMGVLFAAPGVLWGTLLQRRVPPALLGRVSSLDFFVSISLMPVSMALVGPVSDLIGVRETFYVAALAPALFGVAALLVAKLPADEIANPLD